MEAVEKKYLRVRNLQNKKNGKNNRTIKKNFTRFDTGNTAPPQDLSSS